jgi:hypothetical protein
MWESRSVFCGGFSKQLVEIIKKKLPKATFVDFQLNKAADRKTLSRVRKV